jgi:S1-C subfamily serine protease
MQISLETTVGRTTSIFFLAVFFAASSHAADAPLQQLESGLNDLVYRLSRSVVSVEATRAISNPLQGSSNQMVQTGFSTGLICDSAGHILVSSNAVIGYDRIQVTGEERSVPAEVVAVDYRNDLAILRPNLPVGAPVTFSDPTGCAGQMVLSLANAYGLRAFPSIGFCAGSRPDGLLQFSVPVSSSSVGGGIFDLSGRLVGVIVGDVGDPGPAATALQSYKIPTIMNYLLTHGSRQAGFIGVASRAIAIDPPMEITNHSLTMPAEFRVPAVLDRAVMIVVVLPGSPASRAGVMPGDLVLGLNGRTVRNSTDLAAVVTQLEPGTIVPLQLARHGAVYTTQVTIGQRPINQAVGRAPRSAPRDRTTDSLFQVLARLKEEMSRLERRLQLID